MSKVKTARKLTKAAAQAATMADCLVCVRLRGRAFTKVNNLINQTGAVMPSRLR